MNIFSYKVPEKILHPVRIITLLLALVLLALGYFAARADKTTQIETLSFVFGGVSILIAIASTLVPSPDLTAITSLDAKVSALQKTLNSAGSPSLYRVESDAKDTKVFKTTRLG